MEGLIHKTSKFTVKQSDDDSRTVEGYANVFGNVDSDMDVIQKGAFKKSIKEWGPQGLDRIKLMAQHNMSRPVAKMLELKEDDKGLYMKAKFGTHTDGEDYYRMAKEGIINEFSVGFAAIEKEDNEAGGYDISNTKLYEVSMVSVAANDQAVVTNVKSADPLKLIKQVDDKDLAFKLEKEMLRLMGNSQKTTTSADVGLEAKEISPEQEVVEKSDILNELLNLYKK